MPLLLLIRHGENEFVKTGKMAGQLPGVAIEILLYANRGLILLKFCAGRDLN